MTWTRSRILGVALAGLLGALGLTACGGGSSSTSASGSHSTITVCGDEALSGVYTQIGSLDNLGAVVYFKYIDAHGGIAGHKVNYLTMNNQSSPSEAELLAKECIEQKHGQVIFGPESGADTESVLPIAISHKIPEISLSSGWASNGYPSSELESYGFPGIENVFYEDDLITAANIIAARHYTRAALIEDNCGSVCLSNKSYVEGLAKHFGFKLVSTAIVDTSATDVTPQVLSMLSAKPQVIILGLVPGTDSITAIRAIRAQDPTIPISECSGCTLPSFIKAVGGPSVMKNVYLLGSNQNLLQVAEEGKTAADKATAAGLKVYFAAMKADGYTSANDIDAASEGWDAGLELTWAIEKAGSTSGPAIEAALQHLNTNTLGIQWDRTPSNYEGISAYVSAFCYVGANGQTTIYSPAIESYKYAPANS